MVRPIKGALEQVAVRLSRSALREFELQSQQTKGDARCRFDYPLYKLRGQETLPPNMHHIANGERGWRRVNSHVWIYSIVGL
jgi:hypothetical protein